MSAQTLTRVATVSIAAVERDTGLSKDTLRVWERRYGFPAPLRDHNDERAYPPEQVARLRLIRRMLDSGYRAGKVVGLDPVSLERMSASRADSTPLPTQPISPMAQHSSLSASSDPLLQLDHLMACIRRHDVPALRAGMVKISQTIGLQRFTCEVIAPLNQRVGAEWISGRLEIFEEHLYTESVNAVLRSALASLGPADAADGPRVLLTTTPKEAHGLGLLMAEVFFASHGCQCVSLGVQTPILDIVRACVAQRTDILALSFTASLNPKLVVSSLRELKELLPSSVQVWAGGACPIIHRKPVDGVVSLSSLDDIGPQLKRWRSKPNLRHQGS